MKNKKSGKLPVKMTACMAVTMLAICSVGCGEVPSDGTDIVLIEQEPEEAGYSLAVATVDDVVKTEKIKCTYRQIYDQEVSFPESGKKIAKVYVQEGDHVTKGQLLAELADGQKTDEIEDLEYQIERNGLLLQHAAENENLEISGRWVSYQYQSGRTDSDAENRDEAISEIQRNYRYRAEDYQDAIDIAKLKLDKLRQEERNSHLYAEMEGTVSSVKENLEGSTTTADEIIMKVIDESQCLFVSENIEYRESFDADTELTMDIKSGTGAGQYILIPWEQENWEDVMYFTMKAAPETTIEVEAFGTAGFVYDSREQVLSVPLQAVHIADDKPYVYVLGENDSREIKWIETGLYGDSNVEVTEGLTEGEKVILK